MQAIKVGGNCILFTWSTFVNVEDVNEEGLAVVGTDLYIADDNGNALRKHSNFDMTVIPQTCPTTPLPSTSSPTANPTKAPGPTSAGPITKYLCHRNEKSPEEICNTGAEVTSGGTCSDPTAGCPGGGNKQCWVAENCGGTPVCNGDGNCDTVQGEDASNCPDDCSPVCNNDNVCDSGEDANNCPNDCGSDPACAGPGEGCKNTVCCTGTCPNSNPKKCPQ